MKKTVCHPLILFSLIVWGCAESLEAPNEFDAEPRVSIDVDRDLNPADFGAFDMHSSGALDASSGITIDAQFDAQPMDAGRVDLGNEPVDAQPPIADSGVLNARSCFANMFVNEPEFGPDYDQFEPTIGDHCLGTNHQRIEDVERVVFVGDSVTVGTPPQDPLNYYRYLLAVELAERFGLEPPDWTWAQVNLISGTSLIPEAGDFACCARYGARTDDFIRDNSLLAGCVTPEQQNLRTLFVITMGGNDVSSLTQAGLDGASVEALWAQTYEFVELMREAVAWMKDPMRFPQGSYVVFANMFEFTDGTGDVTACPAAGLAGFGAEWADPDLLAELVVWANEQYMDIAVESQGDMVFLLESFCGHGFNSQDPQAPCYRGPGTANWFDLSCIHPNTEGHRQIAELFRQTILQ